MTGRFIPTPVGNTTPAQALTTPPAVHPHARGEHANNSTIRNPLGGSSPRPWGTRVLLPLPSIRTRFIPTPVGNTSPPRHSRPLLPVHPHARGEHNMLKGCCLTFSGSSPRPWGTPHPHIRPSAPDRFIPTPVGNTNALRRLAGCSPVHPHARGEHLNRMAGSSARCGSTPRPGGTLFAKKSQK